MMEVKHSLDKGLFYVEKGSEKIAVLTYVFSRKDLIIIEHTVVDEVLKGQGAGKLLVAKAVAFARENELKIIPACSFAKAVFEKTEGYNDLMINSTS